MIDGVVDGEVGLETPVLKKAICTKICPDSSAVTTELSHLQSAECRTKCHCRDIGPYLSFSTVQLLFKWVADYRASRLWKGVR